MQPTDVQATELRVAAEDLRNAGIYLIRHGWCQGALCGPGDPVEPPASAGGAIRIVTLGYPDPRPWWELSPHEFHRICSAESLLAAFLTVEGLVAAHPNVDKARHVVRVYNDRHDTAAAHVVGALLAAATMCQQALDGNW
jgi:hypothetical protein